MNPLRNASLQLVIPIIHVDFIRFLKFFPLLSFNNMEKGPFLRSVGLPFPDGFIKLLLVVLQGIVNVQGIFQSGKKYWLVQTTIAG